MCFLGEKDDRQEEGSGCRVYLQAKSTGNGLDIAMDFGCAMWNDEQYDGLPDRDTEDIDND